MTEQNGNIIINTYQMASAYIGLMMRQKNQVRRVSY